MPLTVGQVKKRAKLALWGIAGGIGIFFLDGMVFTLFRLNTNIFIIGHIMSLFSGFYLVYLQIKYPEIVRILTKPHNKARGGMLSDTLSGMDEQVINSKLGNLGRSAKSSEPAIKIRCQSCGHLNDETDKFCGECGAKM